MKNSKWLIATWVSGWAMSSFAAPPQLSLIADLGFRGDFRYCEYSNAKIYAFNASRECPVSLKAPAEDGRGIGVLRGESNEGSSKLCVYRVAGQDRNLRMDNNAQCPLNHTF